MLARVAIIISRMRWLGTQNEWGRDAELIAAIFLVDSHCAMDIPRILRSLLMAGTHEWQQRYFTALQMLAGK